ncbi:unnamed protein product [Arabis nemorensis]|uniref:Uncharacterized protein n=1 Tax=Arabis nemorensis TaxID=586526 RepID=A0A565C4P6_9BRAS|nr:unnamed protein product [Arabis nemorensis]
MDHVLVDCGLTLTMYRWIARSTYRLREKKNHQIVPSQVRGEAKPYTNDNTITGPVFERSACIKLLSVLYIIAAVLTVSRVKSTTASFVSFSQTNIVVRKINTLQVRTGVREVYECEVILKERGSVKKEKPIQFF